MSASRLYLRQTYEPLIRSTVCGLQQGCARIMALPSGNSPQHLNKALGHMASADAAIRKWCKANDIEIHEVPPT